MYIFNDIGLIILTTMFFIFFYLIFQKIEILNWFQRKSFNKYVNVFVTSVYYGVSIALVQYIILVIKPSFSLPIGTLFVVGLLIVNSKWAAVFNIFPSLLFWLIFYKITPFDYSFWISFVSLSFLYIILKHFFNNKILFTLFFSFATIVSISQYIIFWQINYFAWDDYLLIVKTLIFLLAIILTTFFVIAIVRFLVSANVLLQSNYYTFSNYFRHPSGINAIQDLIIRKQIQYGLFLIVEYQIELNNSSIGLTEKEAKENFLKIFESLVSKDSICFTINENSFGIFKPHFQKNILYKNIIQNNYHKTRSKEDPFIGLEFIVKVFQANQFNVQKDDVLVKLKTGAAIYGLQDCDLDKLQDKAMFALRYDILAENPVKVFNPDLFQKKMNDSERLKMMETQLKLGDFEFLFNNIFNNNSNKKFVITKINRNYEYSQIEIRKYLHLTKWINDFDRYFAIDVLESFKNSDLDYIFLWYQPLLNTPFDIKNFKSKLFEMGVDFKKVILLVEATEDWENIFYENLKIAATNEIKFAFLNLVDNRLIEKIQPNYIVLTPTYFKSKINFDLNKLIFSDISTQKDLEIAIKLNAKNLAGSLIFESSKAQMLDKKSKMYIIDLIKGSEG